MSEESTTLANFSRVKQALNEVRTLDDTLEIRSQAAAMETYASAKGADEVSQMAMEIKLRAERKAGQFIADMKKQGIIKQGGDQKSKLHDERLILKRDYGVEPLESHRWQRIAKIPEERFEEYIIDIKKRTQTALLQTAHVGHASGENEWYTPREYIEAARLTMGSIDVDPASTEAANQTIKATKYYSIKDNGLIQKWEDNVWMNPPYSQPLITEFCNLLVEKLKNGEIKQACVLVNNATETIFYQNMLNYCNAICFIKGRVKFIDKNGQSTGAPLQGQTILYFGDNRELFAENFDYFGVVFYAKQ